MNSKIFVLSLGGSLINPGEIDVDFLQNFKNLILTRIKKGERFIIIAGGGKPARMYQQALQSVTQSTKTNIDWMGIYATRLNAELIRLMFGKLAYKTIIEDPNKKVLFKEKILVAGGWAPGRSTDDDAVRLAKVYKSSTIINLSNIDYVYTKDPKKFSDAQKIEHTTWKELQKIIGTKWVPGANTPFDPTAAKFAKANKLSAIITNGKDLANLNDIFDGKEIKGTIIK